MNWRWYVRSDLSSEALLSQGEVVSDGARIRVVRFQLTGRTYYRKEACGERLGRLLDRVARGGGWCSMPEQEARNLMQLEKDGFQVVPVIAAGSAFRYGVPVFGVMVSVALDAPLLEEVLGTNGELWFRYGGLVGRLHRCGYFDDCRAKDVLLDGQDLVLLDREKSRTDNHWSYRNALKSLKRTFYRNLRSGICPDEGAAKAFWAGYRAGVGLSSEAVGSLQQQISFSARDGSR